MSADASRTDQLSGDARLDDIIRAQQIAKGRDEVFNPKALAERLQMLGPLVALDVLERVFRKYYIRAVGRELFAQKQVFCRQIRTGRHTQSRKRDEVLQ